MTLYEALTVCTSATALFISLVSLVRSRRTSLKQLELESANARLAEKQLAKIEAQEEREGQPTFVIRSTNIYGADPVRAGFSTKITFSVENTGEEYLDPGYVTLVCMREGVFKICPNASLDYPDRDKRDRILGERTITLKPGCNMHECVIHISYIDRSGSERTQEFEIFPEGPMAEIPFKVFFTYKRTWRLVPSTLWNGGITAVLK